MIVLVISYYFVCLDSSWAQADWAIQTMIVNIFELSELILTCRFCWVSRACNSTAHSNATAKLAVSIRSSFCCKQLNLAIVISDVLGLNVHVLVFVLWMKWFSLSQINSVFCPGKEKVEGEELQEWLKLVVAPTELKVFIRGKQESYLPLQTGSW